MKISFDQKTVTLSIGEFAAFSVDPSPGSDGRPAGLWRAQLGTHWHETLRERSEKETPGARFEVPVRGRWPHRDWIVELQGRADQVLPAENGVLLREIKTVTTPLPASESDLRETYPAYFRQLAAYRALYPLGREGEPLPEYPRAELLFLEIATGFTQRVPLGADDSNTFEAQLERLVGFLQFRETHLRRLRHSQILPPFETPRPGQEGMSRRLAEAARESPIALFQAPTGFGKTGFLLEMALNALRDGRITRIVYLTGKSTGQLQVLRQLRGMLPPDAPVSYLQVRNKRDHCIHSVFHCFRDTCPYLEDVEARWKKSGLGGELLHDRNELNLDALREAGKRARICPYEITRATLAGADVWVGDYNYVFSPANRSFFHDRPGFDPAQTLLIVDEAHNLPSRVADNYSVRLAHEDARDVLTEFTFRDVAPGVIRAWQSLADLLAGLRSCDACDADTEDSLRAAAVSLGEEMLAAPPDFAALSPDILSRLDAGAALRDFLENAEIDKLLWVPRPGVLEATCLDASIPLGNTLRTFRSVALASATFRPEAHFLRQCGLDTAQDSVTQVTSRAPWRAGAYDVAADLRIDTRYRQRTRHLPAMAETIARLTRQASGPVVAFFPSYRYARTVLDELESRFPHLSAALQERRETLAEQAAFIEESLLLADALFLILGSSYAESIDLLGGRIDYALIAGPALPEVNPVQNARMERADPATRDERFHAVYQIPGMQKINQALGRLVRAPGHRTRVLLQCARFADPSYLDLLDPDFRPAVFITADEDLEAWLQPADPP